MNITVNGEELTLDAPCSIAQLVQERNLAEAACAVEVNRELVRRRDHPLHELADGDIVEIVTLVGGG